jgi:hypothetical protein
VRDLLAMLINKNNQRELNETANNNNNNNNTELNLLNYATPRTTNGSSMRPIKT